MNDELSILKQTINSFITWNNLVQNACEITSTLVIIGQTTSFRLVEYKKNYNKFCMNEDEINSSNFYHTNIYNVQLYK